MADTIDTRPSHTCYHAEFSCSGSNCMIVDTGPKIWACCGPTHQECVAWLTAKKTPVLVFPMSFHAEFARSRSNNVCVIMVIIWKI